MEEDKRMGRKKFQFGLTKNARTGTKKPQTVGSHLCIPKHVCIPNFDLCVRI